MIDFLKCFSKYMLWMIALVIYVVFIDSHTNFPAGSPLIVFAALLFSIESVIFLILIFLKIKTTKDYKKVLCVYGFINLPTFILLTLFALYYSYDVITINYF